MKYSELSEAIQSNSFQNLCNDFAIFTSMNMVMVSKYAIDQNAANELKSMQQQFRSPAVNGKTFHDVIGDRAFMNNPKGRGALLNYIYQMIKYIEPRINKFVNDEGKKLYLPRFQKIKQQYIDLVNKQQ
jgi:hypothetical protein